MALSIMDAVKAAMYICPSPPILYSPAVRATSSPNAENMRMQAISSIAPSQ